MPCSVLRQVFLKIHSKSGLNRRHGLALALCLCAPIAVVQEPVAEAAPDAIPTFTHDVAPILFKHCVRCHREPGPMADLPLSRYQTVASKRKEIRDKVTRRAMPPWPVDAASSVPFANDPRLEQRDIDTLVTWIDGGAPLGSEAEMPPDPIFAKGWSHPDGRPPDAVVTLPRFTLSANGTVPYLERLIKVPFDHDRNISAIEVRAGNPKVLHHMGITEVSLPEGVTPESLSSLDSIARRIGAPSGRLQVQRPAVSDPLVAGAYDMFGVYTPGTTFESFGESNGKLLKGGSNLYLNFNIHYTTSGVEESDVSQLGIWFAPQAPLHLLLRAPTAISAIIANGRQLLTDDPGTKAEGTSFALPPIAANDANYELIGMTAFMHAVTIYQLQPHAHVRAASFSYRVVYPDGRELSLLSVPHYSYHFQLAYTLAQPLVLPAGSKIIVVARYDNSTGNPQLQHLGSNLAAQRCGPEKVAYFSQQNQSWDEMFSPFIQYSNDGPDPHSDRPLVTAVGCLVRRSADWSLVRASPARRIESQGLSSVELAAASEARRGSTIYRLLGVEPFAPADRRRRAVVVAGVLIPNANGAALNVTSMYPAQASCP